MQDNKTEWTTDGITASAGDHFGDVQRSVAEVLTYTRPDRPDERVSVTFGVVLNQAGRFSGEVTVEHQVKDPHGEWEHAPGTGLEYEDGEFYRDHDDFGAAKMDVAEAIAKWGRQGFSDAELGIG